jgi:hypothetical protein
MINTIYNIKTPSWADHAQTMIQLQIQFDANSEYLPYCAMICNDPLATELYNRAVDGEFGDIVSLDSDSYAKTIIQKRNNLLFESDWTQLPDVPDTIKFLYLTYRQQLRDITLQKGFPFDVIFPEKPKSI